MRKVNHKNEATGFWTQSINHAQVLRTKYTKMNVCASSFSEGNFKALYYTSVLCIVDSLLCFLYIPQCIFQTEQGLNPEVTKTRSRANNSIQDLKHQLSQYLCLIII